MLSKLKGWGVDLKAKEMTDRNVLTLTIRWLAGVVLALLSSSSFVDLCNLKWEEEKAELEAIMEIVCKCCQIDELLLWLVLVMKIFKNQNVCEYCCV